MKEAMTSSGLPTSNQHSFARVPGIERPRSTFVRESSHKTTFKSGYYIPVYWDEVLPGDTHQVEAQIFARITAPLKFPIMDNMYMDWIAIYAPNRILWEHFINQMGEQANPGDSIDYLTPQLGNDGSAYTFTAYSLGDYLGVPTGVAFPGSGTTMPTAYLFRMYNRFYNDWVKSQDLISAVAQNVDDGPDPVSDYVVLQRMKRFDYFTGCLPNAQKGTAPGLNVGGTAPVVPDGTAPSVTQGTDTVDFHLTTSTTTLGVTPSPTATGNVTEWVNTGMEVNGSSFTAVTINALRLLITTQQLLELNQRGGTRFPEIVFNHFGVVSSDARMQRTEFLGAGTVAVNIHPLAQTSETDATPQGTLAAFATMSSKVSFTRSFEEHGHIMVLVEVRADLTYWQGMHRGFTRLTQLDYYFPVFANIGEQAVLNQEIYFAGGSTDTEVFGYQEYAAEYRYQPSRVSGGFRSNAPTPLDFMHLAQDFGSLPTLGPTFIKDTPPVSRVVASDAIPFQEIIFDSFWRNKTTRVMPVFSVPGLKRV